MEHVNDKIRHCVGQQRMPIRIAVAIVAVAGQLAACQPSKADDAVDGRPVPSIVPSRPGYAALPAIDDSDVAFL